MLLSASDRPIEIDPIRVETVPVLSGRERLSFVALTVFAGAATIAFAWYWLSLGVHRDLGASFWTFVIASLLVCFHVSSWFARWAILWRMRRPLPLAPPPGFRVAAVTTFVPEAEPIKMLEQSVMALVGMEYPHDTWVLDEGDTPEVAALCRRLGARHFSRKHKQAFQADGGPHARQTKYGNYNAWLTEIGTVGYDILAAFDPDHVAEPNFLTRVLGYFRDPSVGYVQAPQVYYNQKTGFIARGAAEESYAYYSCHLMASYGMGQAILIGSHNTQRITALTEVGGFAAHDADDLLITLRYRATNWRGVYVPQILALGTTPVDWYGYLRQQVRWTRSVVDIKLRFLRNLITQLPVIERFLSGFHGAYYLRSFTLPLAYGLLAWLLMRGTDPVFLRLPAVVGLLTLAAALAGVGLFSRRFSLDPKREGGIHWRTLVLQFAKWPYQCLGIWRALRGREAPYALTLKVRRGGEWSLVMGPHWLVAAAMSVALVQGLRFGAAATLELAGGAVIAISILIASSEFLAKAKPWDEAVYRDRRREMTDLLGPIRWPSVERRGFSRTA